MIRLSVNLPKMYRLDVKVVQVRRVPLMSEPILPSIRSLLNIRAGSKVSRIFTHIFQHKHIKKIFGANIALAIMASTLMPVKANFEGFAEQNVVSANTVQITTEKGTVYPVEKISITQGYKFFHPGLDLDGITGDPIHPFMSGKVESVQHSKFLYGNAVMLSHGGEIESLYAHLSKIYVKVGDDVTNKTVIGLMGATGRATGDHLHFEVHENGHPINPLLVLPKNK